MNLEKIFDNENNMYYGHGTGTASSMVINSIMQNGLRCSHGSLYYTSIALGMGHNIDNETFSLIKNWPHKSSSIIIIVSLPNKYNIIESSGLGTYNCANAAFYYTPSVKKQKEYELSNSNYVMPEFIKGYYDSDEDKFVPNPKYYELLPLEEQKKIFEKVKSNYINIINNGCGIRKYQKVIEGLPGWESPLTAEDFEKDKEAHFSSLFNILSDEVKNRKNVLYNNQEISIRQYLWQYVYPFLPENGIVIMKDDTVYLVSEFIENYILKDCIEKYHGDARKYIFENTKNNLGITSILSEDIEINKDILVNDIVNYLNKDLLDSMITLSNGVQMTIRDYLENIYLPYIPYNGKVLLKNGMEVTVQTFIEEYLFKDGKVAYGGDIEKILLNLTCCNDGFVVSDKEELIDNLEKMKNAIKNYQEKKDETVVDEFEFDDDFDMTW